MIIEPRGCFGNRKEYNIKNVICIKCPIITECKCKIEEDKIKWWKKKLLIQ